MTSSPCFHKRSFSTEGRHIELGKGTRIPPPNHETFFNPVSCQTKWFISRLTLFTQIFIMLKICWLYICLFLSSRKKTASVWYLFFCCSFLFFRCCWLETSQPYCITYAVNCFLSFFSGRSALRVFDAVLCIIWMLGLEKNKILS